MIIKYLLFTIDCSRFWIRFLIFTFYVLLFTNPGISQEIDTTEYRTPAIEVDALRGTERVVPITLENIKRESIEKKYWMQDLPMFINGSTNINAYSESGASIGYSYFTIRGFDQRRISILVNGTSQNDAEDHQVYWAELSDIISSTESIQIQRGIGTALFGTSGIGGVVNIQTIDYFKNKFININAGYGDYNSKRYSLEYASGLTKSGFGFYGKLSKSNTSGYRNLSWSDHWSYFFSAGKTLGANSVIKLNVFGSPIKNHLAYNGITKDYLDGNVTGDRRIDRKYNPLEYPNETDNIRQPHFELVYNLQATKDLFISNTFNYVRRDGNQTTNYTVDKGFDFSYFHLPAFFYASDTTSYNSNYYLRNYRNRIDSFPGLGYKVVRSDMVVNLFLNSNDYGWYPKLQWKHSDEKGNLLIGGEVRLHNSEHYGEIASANALPPGTTENHRFYFYNGKKRTISFYANEFTNIDKRFSGMIGVQFTYHKYSIENDAFKPYNFDVDYNFLTSRIGFNYNIRDDLRAFASVSIARREPRLKDFYDADSPYSKPYFAVVDTVNQIYSDPLVKHEEVTDFEFGFGYNTNILKANLNFYWMNYTNEIVSNGQLDNTGQPVYWNAGKSVHRGIELEAEYNLLAKILSGSKFKTPLITLSGNLSLTDNYFVTFFEKNSIDTTGVIHGNDYSGNQILLNPQIIGNLSLSFYSEFGLGVYIRMQYIGKQYLDNSENEIKNPDARLVPGYVDKFINPYTVLNAGVSLDFIPLVKSKQLSKYFKTLEATLKVNNVLNTLYEATGGIDNLGTPNWIPAADRNVFLNLRIGF